MNLTVGPYLGEKLPTLIIHYWLVGWLLGYGSEFFLVLSFFSTKASGQGLRCECG